MTVIHSWVRSEHRLTERRWPLAYTSLALVDRTSHVGFTGPILLTPFPSGSFWVRYRNVLAFRGGQKLKRWMQRRFKHLRPLRTCKSHAPRRGSAVARKFWLRALRHLPKSKGKPLPGWGQQAL